MPLYEYKCLQCGQKFSLVRSGKDFKKKGQCPNCMTMAGRMISLPNIITDTNFFYTGKVDNRLGDMPIEGRQDFRKRVADKGYREISGDEGMATTTTTEERVASIGK